MGFRFRRSLRLAPGVRLNVGTKGVGISAGVRGARVGINSRGVYSSVGIPGTGISNLTYHSRHSKPLRSGLKPIVEGHGQRTIQTRTSTGVVWLIVANGVLMLVNRTLGFVAVIASLIFYHFYFRQLPRASAKISLKKAQRAFTAGAYEISAPEFAAAYDRFQDDKAIAFYAAVSFANLGELDKVVYFTNEYLTTHDDDSDAKLMLASAFYELGDKRKALSTIQSLPEAVKLRPEVLLISADILDGLGAVEGAIGVLKQAPLTKRKLTPELLELVYRLGVLYEKNGNTKGARSCFERVFAMDACYKDVADRISASEQKSKLP